jgi:hypothetical protein
VAVLAYALFVVGAPRPYLGARVFGGTTEGVRRLSLRVAVVRRFVEVEEPASLAKIEIAAEGAGRREVVLDERGMGVAELDLGGAPGRARLSVTTRDAQGTLLLADGIAELPLGEWRARARLRGGWLQGSVHGNALMRVGPGRGAFAVPFADPLWIEVRAASGPVASATVVLEPDGFDLVDGASPVITDVEGRAIVRIAPRDHVAWLKASATGPGGIAVEWSGPIPVTAGALHASLQDDQLRIESAIERDVAYWALQSDRARLAGGPVALSPTGRGGAVALVRLPPDARAPELWAVVSGEPELDSASTVGWPLAPGGLAPGPDPPLARAVPDRLLVDGLLLGYRADAARRHRARQLALGFTLLSALLAGALLVAEGRRAAARHDAHLRAAGATPNDADAIAQRKSRWFMAVVALLCVAMGFIVVLLVALHRIG